MDSQLQGPGGKQFVHCKEVVLLLECPLSEVLLYMYSHVLSVCSAASQKNSLVPRPSVERGKAWERG